MSLLFKNPKFASFLLLMLYSTSGYSDGSSIDKVYHPYVVETEREIEWRTVFQSDAKDRFSQQIQRLGLGYSFTDSLFTEIYIIGERLPQNNFKIAQLEFEALWQLTEQGEYEYDWGLLFELESRTKEKIWDLSTGLLIERSWGRWTGTANIALEYEWGEDIQNEFETSFATQFRYRYQPSFEPAIEFYQSQNTTAIGPVIMGNLRFGSAKKLHWELGVLFGLKDNTANETLKTIIEYEF